MKKLFTLCASALLAFTLSAQAETSEGTYYLSTGDCTQFVKDGGISFDNLSLGYAVNDDVVIMATVNNLGQEDAEGNSLDNTFDLGVRYFMNGIYLQGTIHNATADGENGDERSMSVAAGTFYDLGNIFEGDILGNMYLDPAINIALDSDTADFSSRLSTSMGIGYRF